MKNMMKDTQSNSNEQNVELIKMDPDEGTKITGFLTELNFEIHLNKEKIGTAHLNALPFSDYNLEWIQFDDPYIGKGYLRKTLKAIMDYFNSYYLYLESPEKNLAMYEHIGAKKIGYDKFRKTTYMKILERSLRKENTI